MSNDFVKIQCPSCEKRLKIPRNKFKVNKKIVCPKCNGKFRCPSTPNSENHPVNHSKTHPKTNSVQTGTPADLELDSFEPEVPNGSFDVQDDFANSQTPSPPSAGNYWRKSGSSMEPATPAKRKTKSTENAELSEQDERWKQGGIALVVFGIGSSILPFLGLQWRRMRFDGTSASVAGLIFGLSGAALFAYAMRNNRKEGLGLAVGMTVIVISASLTGYIFQSLNSPTSNNEHQGKSSVQNPFDTDQSNFNNLKRKPTRIR